MPLTATRLQVTRPGASWHGCKSDAMVLYFGHLDDDFSFSNVPFGHGPFGGHAGKGRETKLSERSGCVLVIWSSEKDEKKCAYASRSRMEFETALYKKPGTRSLQLVR